VARHWVLGSDGKPRTVGFKGSPRDKGWVPYGKTDKGGGASKVTWPFKSGSKRVRLWRRKPEKVERVEYVRQFTFDKGGKEYFTVDAVIYEDFESAVKSDKRSASDAITKIAERMIKSDLKDLTVNNIKNYYDFLDNFDLSAVEVRGGWRLWDGVSYVDVKRV